MTFFERFSELANARGSSPNGIAKQLRIPSGSVTAWSKGTLPQIATVIKLADYFNVTIDYLLCREIAIAPAGEQPILTEAQKKRGEIHEMLSGVSDDKLDKFKNLLQAAIDAVK